MHAKGRLALARISEHFQAAMRTSWRFKWRYAGEWFAKNQPWSVPKNTQKYFFKLVGTASKGAVTD